ncbi:rod shape-determining protein RodA [Candidatus Omnitrophota bacterium]
MFNWKTGKNFDFVLLLLVVLIFAIGLTFLFSATYQYSYTTGSGLAPANFLIRQIIWFVLAILASAIILGVSYQKWLELAYPLYVVNLLLLLLVLVLGQTRLGAQRWIGFSNIGFQPSESIKIVIILTLARFLGPKPSGSAKDIFVSFAIIALPFLLIVKQPDLGTALTLIPILFTILYVWGVRLRTLLLIIFGAVLSTPALWHFLKEYQKRRILVFINPNIDPLGAGYTVIQSKIAIGSGRIIGKGWLSGTQNQLNFLPERHTDFIFSVVGEEWGFLGAVLLLGLYAALIWRSFNCLKRTGNASARLLGCGIIMLFSFQVAVNIAMTMGLVPVVGLPLPLISYGGSSLLATMVSLAFILNIGLRRTVF